MAASKARVAAHTYAPRAWAGAFPNIWAVLVVCEFTELSRRAIKRTRPSR